MIASEEFKDDWLESRVYSGDWLNRNKTPPVQANSTLASQLWPFGQSWKRRKWLFPKLLRGFSPTLAKLRRHINSMQKVQRVGFRSPGYLFEMSQSIAFGW
jgi:hypothetical protein